MSSESRRLNDANERKRDWKLWGPYLSERAWGTVREDYSPDGAAWDYFTFDIAHQKAYRWNEDGIGGISDRSQQICFSVAMWNGKDPLLKERLFGLSGPEGNHAEDVKECYYHLDSTPTHSYLRFLYKYPINEFPYDDLREENRTRGSSEPEYELIDTGIFDDDEYFDVFVEYAKDDFDDIYIRIEAHNRSGKRASLRLIPQIWFRNTWSWSEGKERPVMREADIEVDGLGAIQLREDRRGIYWLLYETPSATLFTENETNYSAVYGSENASDFTKDAFHRYVIDGEEDAVNPERTGTKAGLVYELDVPAGESESVCLRLCGQRPAGKAAFTSADLFRAKCSETIKERRSDADEFYSEMIPETLSEDAKNVLRQAYAGLLWSKQYYHYVVDEWIDGDPAFAPPPAERVKGRNGHWRHFHAEDIISMPDKWEYPWFAAWDLAFQCIPLAQVDAYFAKRQMLLLLREWFMHPNGQIPAYEWAFEDVNPPVHAFAALRIYEIEREMTGNGDRGFLEKVFHKLLLNFTWWVNRKDSEGDNVFEGGFLGLDNIGIFDRSAELPTGGHLEQSDGTSWMAMYCLNMLAIALELAVEDEVYEDVATKFFEHFVFISDAMNNLGHEDTELWNERDGFYYDVLHLPGDYNVPLKIRSMVGLIPLFAVDVLEAEWMNRMPVFKRRTDWFLRNRPELVKNIACMHPGGKEERLLLAAVNKDRLKRVLRVMLSEREFLSENGIRALSRAHKSDPFFLMVKGTEYKVDYEPGESTSELFGGNSNWRGPVWFPMNYLIVESLKRFHQFYGDGFKVEFPTGSERMLDLSEVALKIEERLCSLFLRDDEGRRPFQGNVEKFQTDEHFKDHILFHEYFHGDNGKGLGASHQTGWTALVALMLADIARTAE